MYIFVRIIEFKNEREKLTNEIRALSYLFPDELENYLNLSRSFQTERGTENVNFSIKSPFAQIYSCIFY